MQMKLILGDTSWRLIWDVSRGRWRHDLSLEMTNINHLFIWKNLLCFSWWGGDFAHSNLLLIVWISLRRMIWLVSSFFLRNLYRWPKLKSPNEIWPPRFLMKYDLLLMSASCWLFDSCSLALSLKLIGVGCVEVWKNHEELCEKVTESICIMRKEKKKEKKWWGPEMRASRF